MTCYVDPCMSGVIIGEGPGRVPPAITGVATSITAFVGRTRTGPVNQPVPIRSFAEFEQQFGGLWTDSGVSFAVRDFFLNGGTQAVIVRLFRPFQPRERQRSNDGLPLTPAEFLPANPESHQGLFALDSVFFNLLCIPPYRAEADPVDVDVEVVAAAAAYCEKCRAFLVLDSPKSWSNANAARQGVADAVHALGTTSQNTAVYYPRLRQNDPTRNNQEHTFAACGAVAGVIARTDQQRGVWKAPAGLEAKLIGANGPSLILSNEDNVALNSLGVNCLRSFTSSGTVVWGSRTLAGSDARGDNYKYVPMRRTSLFIEESLKQGLQWTVFEPNDEALWAKIRLAAGEFMHALFRQGAFTSATPNNAYMVKCDAQTTTQADIDAGVVNIVVGFAPLKPAEFVLINIRQLALRPDDP